MPSPTNEFLNPNSLVLPKMTTAVRDTLVAEVAKNIYNTTTNKINICKTAAAGSSSWEAVTSA